MKPRIGYTLAVVAILVAAALLFLLMIWVAESDSGPPQRLAGTDHRLRPDMGSTALPVAVPRPSTVPSAKPRPVHVSRSLVRVPAGFAAWRASAHAHHVLACESHTNYTDMSQHSGVIYRGAWQMNAAFWTTYGGPARYLADRSRFTAPPLLQDQIAYRGWLARGWSPWSCG